MFSFRRVQVLPMGELEGVAQLDLVFILFGR